MNKYTNIMGFLAILLISFLSSCDDKYPKSHEDPYGTELNSIRILNGGVDGKTVFEGKINLDKKEIPFLE